ncbi:outer membrane lipoprotein SlyB [Azospirillum baldaniorum]|nr:outer membrane lipoprotein SlyB [Azospirillum baldaniorum]
MSSLYQETKHRRSMKRGLAAAMLGLTVLSLGACAGQSQNRYSYRDVGQATSVEVGTVMATRPVDIQGQNTGVGGLVGGAAGGLALSNVGKGSGNVAAILGGAVVGAVAGAVAEQAISDRTGIEYVVTLATGRTITIVQEQGADEPVFGPGQRVMVQTNGTYQRVLSADHLPTETSRPEGIKVVN